MQRMNFSIVIAVGRLTPNCTGSKNVRNQILQEGDEQ